MDILGKFYPYVKLSLSGERLPSKKTSVKMNNLNPEWNVYFKLDDITNQKYHQACTLGNKGSLDCKQQSINKDNGDLAMHQSR
ncbi:Synaptotagmin-3 [Platanthera zijinensis]|uniref:Synaptotagmin-3 n=1 Tax=Platanthera zijinensis TaxID=2320716 RepID=A0AAP0BPP4_9ASPA